MEEDIKIVKELIENKHGELLNCWDYGEEVRKSLNNILNELERLQKENEKLKNEKTVHTCLHCGNDTPLYCENCYQELISKNAELQSQVNMFDKAYTGAIQESKKWFDTAFDIAYDSIPKQVVRNKIEEVNKEYKKYTEKWEKSGMNKEHPFYRYIVRLEAQIDILKELLGE